MLAILGHITAQNFRFPGMLSPSAGLSFADCPNGVAALSKIPLYGLVQIFLFIGFLETKVRFLSSLFWCQAILVPGFVLFPPTDACVCFLLSTALP